MIQSIKTVATAACVAALLLAGGCGEDEFGAACSECRDGTPVGPSADQPSCQAFGDEWGCGEATLTNAGMCGDETATCTVSDCRELVGLCIP
ncbi:MAG: hypothetical protein AAF500_11785 [Myxococcota bacterium]